MLGLICFIFFNSSNEMIGFLKKLPTFGHVLGSDILAYLTFKIWSLIIIGEIFPSFKGFKSSYSRFGIKSLLNLNFTFVTTKELCF